MHKLGECNCSLNIDILVYLGYMISLLKRKDPVSVNKFIRKITDRREYLIEINNN